MDCSFENVHTENLGFCANKDSVGGVAVNFLYIPAAQVETFTLPVLTEASTYEERITIASGGIVPATGKGWKKAVMHLDQNEIKPVLVGSKGNKKQKTEFDAYIPNFLARNVGFVDAHKNTPLIWAIPDSTGKMWIIGTPDAPAYFDKADGTSGKAYEDDSGVSITVAANTKPYVYAGEIVELADTVPAG